MESRITYSALAVIVVWIASKIFDYFDSRSKSNKEKEKFIRTLYAEIDLNTRDMEEFLRTSADISAVSAAIRSNRDFIPHITDSRSKDVYESKIELIHFAGNDYIADVIEFYGAMDRITREIEGIYLPSYKVISDEGRVACIEDIVAFTDACAVIGVSLLRDMEETYPYLHLKRKNKKATHASASAADLEQRRIKLDLDLDRARSNHRPAS